MEKITEPFIRIVEQPARSAVRFRYECEGRSAGPIPGVNSTSNCATYPTIQIMNYSGNRAMVVVSCVTVTEPYRQHPHHLVGRVGCHNGICTMIVDNCDHLCTFTHLGIQCAKRNEIASRLKMRKQLQIDPTFGGFDHISKSSRSLDLGAIRLCFQAYVEDPITRKFTKALQPIVSDPVYDKKLLPKLIITDISTTSCPMSGGKVMLFCNYIDEEDIEVRFYRTDNTGAIVWESVADLKPPMGEIHKRVGISLLAPAYSFPETRTPVHAFLQLRRPSDQKTSEPIVFTYLPDCGYENCPLLEFNRVNTADHLSNVQQNNSHSKRSRKQIPSPYPLSSKNKFNSKRIKVMNVLNGSDSEDVEETEDADEEEEETVDSSTNSQPFQCPPPNTLFVGNQFSGQMLTKADINNNLRANQNNSFQNYLVNGSNPPNDLLVECLKTIDIESLAAMQFSDIHHHYSEEDWAAVTQAVNGYENAYNYINNDYNENMAFNQNQHSFDNHNQENRSFIDL